MVLWNDVKTYNMPNSYYNGYIMSEYASIILILY